MTDPVGFALRRAAAASNRRLWSRYRLRISLRSAASTASVSAFRGMRFRRALSVVARSRDARAVVREALERRLPRP
jgi:hypothetical protein